MNKSLKLQNSSLQNSSNHFQTLKHINFSYHVPTRKMHQNVTTKIRHGNWVTRNW